MLWWKVQCCFGTFLAGWWPSFRSNYLPCTGAASKPAGMGMAWSLPAGELTTPAHFRSDPEPSGSLVPAPRHLSAGVWAHGSHREYMGGGIRKKRGRICFIVNIFPFIPLRVVLKYRPRRTSPVSNLASYSHAWKHVISVLLLHWGSEVNRGQSGGGGVLTICHAARLTGQDNNKTGIYLNHLAFQLIMQTSIPGSFCFQPSEGWLVIGMLTCILIWEDKCPCSFLL